MLNKCKITKVFPEVLDCVNLLNTTKLEGVLTAHNKTPAHSSISIQQMKGISPAWFQELMTKSNSRAGRVDGFLPMKPAIQDEVRLSAG